MECPGLHSVYSELALSFDNKVTNNPMLKYEVTACDTRVSLLTIKVMAPSVKGTIKAFLRPSPQEQASFRHLRKHVDADEFSGQRALIIGGSRGLGEVSLKLLAAGGAQVKFTYHQGREDAHRITTEILSANASADCLQFDVLKPVKDLSDRLGKRWVPTHLYYFSTPFIFAANKGSFSDQLFSKFCSHYVTGFLNTVEALWKLGPDLTKIFYPSSVAIDELPQNMGEYSAAKMAGEILCTFLEKSHQNIRIHKPRLPRMATDQTVSYFSVNNQNPIPLILENLRYLRDT